MSNGGSYDPHSIEPKIYKFWEEGRYFHAEPDPDRKPYVIDIPLPNVTGSLHLGHALNNTVQDILIRQKRMCGYNAMWMPGTDHAGIATQAVVEKRLKEDENLTRHEIGREGLVKRIWEWKEKYGGQILQQLRRIGCSCDWERTRFTLDEVCAKAVYEVFFQWFKDGLIYRGLRLVNWDAQLQTAVADDEIIYETVQSNLWHYRYPIVPSDEVTERRSNEVAAGPAGNVAAGPRTGRRLDEATIRLALERAARADARLGEDYLSIATTRPETMLGDTAVAVHPDDERYKHLIGKSCLLPLMDRPIPIIADPILVKMEFGTGCVKVTPGHDPNDYEFGQRHEAEIAAVVGRAMINILTPDGKISENGGKYAGMTVEDARAKVVADLEALGLMEQIEPYQHEVGHSDRSKTPIEPMLSEQWFMKMSALADKTMDAVRDGRVKFFPERYAKTYLDWLGEKRDWCISRQLWWGHRIPVWRWSAGFGFVEPGASGRLKDAVDKGLVAVNYQRDTREHQALMAALGEGRPSSVESVPGVLKLCFCPRPEFMNAFAEIARGLDLEQDPDVLDTWFSSQLWPFSTLGWPDDYGRHEGTEARRHEGEGEAPAEPGSAGASPSLSDLDYFYPTSTLVTAREIITLWVARMVMSGLYFMKDVPFRHVHIHPNIQDGQGRRMSKSLNNGVDPIDIIELYGTDAMRFTLAQMATETQDVRMPVKPVKLPDGRQVNSSEKFELGRNFCNKLWQAATGFVVPNLEGSGFGVQGSGWPRPLQSEQLPVEDHWILSRLRACIEEVDRRFERYQLNEATSALYAFFWGEFCDWYVELVKPRLFSRNDAGEMVRHEDESAQVAQQVLTWVLDQTLRLLHPFMPFITEELWHRLNDAAPRRGITELVAPGKALIVAEWPDASAWKREAAVEREMQALQDVIRALREIRNHVNGIRSAARQSAIKSLPRAVVKAEAGLTKTLRAREPMIHRLGQCETLEIGPDVARPPESVSKVLSGIEVYVPLSGLADLDIERKRLRKERDQLNGHIQRLAGKLANEGFVAKAPPEVVKRERSRLAELREKLNAVERNLAEVGG